MSEARRRLRDGIWAAGSLLAGLLPGDSQADVPVIAISADQPLRFGSFVVPGSGSRTVAATGVVTGEGVLPAGNAPAGPAQYTITYDRGSERGGAVSVVVQVLLAVSPVVDRPGLSGALSGFDTDLPGVGRLVPGQIATFTMTDCAQRRCSQTFHVGARLDIASASGGAMLVLSLPLSATVQAVF